MAENDPKMFAKKCRPGKVNELIVACGAAMMTVEDTTADEVVSAYISMGARALEAALEMGADYQAVKRAAMQMVQDVLIREPVPSRRTM